MTRRKGRIRRVLRFVFGWGAYLVLALFVLSVASVAALRWMDPPTSAFIERHRLAVTRAEQPERLPRQRWVPFDQINPVVPLAVVASEDQRFPEHHGLDFDAIRDALEERRDGGRLRGASTISQQVAKNLFLWSGRSFVRKGLEGYLTVLIELLWTKERILEVYLNLAEFGDGVYGVAVAAEQYFDRSPAEVEPAQAALLAAVLPSPKRFDATEPSAYIRERQAWILEQVEHLGADYLERR